MPNPDSKDARSRSLADATRFSLRGLPLLRRGATMNRMGNAENLWLHAKVYSCGGENSLHAHVLEDHCFLVLQGRATFYFGDGSSCEVAPFEGIMLPKGTTYRFEAHEGENLVLFRAGGANVQNPDDVDPRTGVPNEIRKQRVGSNGAALNSRSTENKTPSEPIVIAPGEFFPRQCSSQPTR